MTRGARCSGGGGLVKKARASGSLQSTTTKGPEWGSTRRRGRAGSSSVGIVVGGMASGSERERRDGAARFALGLTRDGHTDSTLPPSQHPCPPATQPLRPATTAALRPATARPPPAAVLPQAASATATAARPEERMPPVAAAAAAAASGTATASTRAALGEKTTVLEEAAGTTTVVAEAAEAAGTTTAEEAAAAAATEDETTTADGASATTAGRLQAAMATSPRTGAEGVQSASATVCPRCPFGLGVAPVAATDASPPPARPTTSTPTRTRRRPALAALALAAPSRRLIRRPSALALASTFPRRRRPLALARPGSRRVCRSAQGRLCACPSVLPPRLPPPPSPSRPS